MQSKAFILQYVIGYSPKIGVNALSNLDDLDLTVNVTLPHRHHPGRVVLVAILVELHSWVNGT